MTKPKFKSVDGLRKHIKRLKDPTYTDKEMVAYSIIDMVFADKKGLDDKMKIEVTKTLIQGIQVVIQAIALATNLDREELRRIIERMLENPTYVMTKKSEFKDLFK